LNLYRLELGSILREKREAQELSMRELSKAVPISLSYISEVESGTKEVSSDMLESICASLNTSIPDVLLELGNNMKVRELI
jgi:transcriptional regulator with XRE-family HTH domain